MSKPIIEVRNISKRYWIGKRKQEDIRESLSSLFSFKSIKKEKIWALKDISFDVHEGEIFGIIGPNGSGKSTLLKILSKITVPTSGIAKLRGKVSSLLEVGTGFHPELTGRENIFFNGSVLGMKRSEIVSKFDEIVDFSGIEKFIDTPVKHYSSGMFVRLAFSVAAHLEPDILLVDEVLSVGDLEFRQKSMGKMKDVAKNGRTVLFVSHNLAHVKKLCAMGLYLENGKTLITGEIKEIVEKYENLYLNPKHDIQANIYSFFDSFRLNILDSKNINTNIIQSGDAIKFELLIDSPKEVFNATIKIEIINNKSDLLFLCNNRHVGHRIDIFKGYNKITCEIPKIPLNIGNYFIHAIIKDNFRIVIASIKGLPFTVIKGDYYKTSMHPLPDSYFLVDHDWTFNKDLT